MEVLLQLVSLVLVVSAGPAVIVLLAARKGNLLLFMTINDNQVFTELFITLITGVFALRLRIELYS
jgi:photosystem I reaction center subunit XII